MAAREFNTRIKAKHDSTANWDAAIGFIPLNGEIIIYDDFDTKQVEEIVDNQVVMKTVNIPNIKVGTGNAYVQDLPFVDEQLRDMLIAHINNHNIHVTTQEKEFWSNKINLDDAEDVLYGELSEDTLIINRN